MELYIDFKGGKKVNAVWEGFTIETDAPKSMGGDGSAPSPTALLLASIGTCAGFYVQFFCQKHDISTDSIKFKVLSENDQQTGLIGKFILDIRVDQSFPEKYVSAIKAVAESCVVKKNIANQPDFDTRVTRS